MHSVAHTSRPSYMTLYWLMTSRLSSSLGTNTWQQQQQQGTWQTQEQEACTLHAGHTAHMKTTDQPPGRAGKALSGSLVMLGMANSTPVSSNTAACKDGCKHTKHGQQP